MTLMIYKKQGKALGFSQLRSTCTALCRLAAYAYRNRLKIPKLLSDAGLLSTFVRSLNKDDCLKVFTLFGNLSKIHLDDIGFGIANNAVFSELKQRVKAYNAQKRQTPPIPSRIYSLVMGNLSAELDSFSDIIDRYLKTVETFFGGLGCSDSVEGDARQAAELISHYGLDAYFEANGLQKSHNGLSRGLNEIQTVCKLTIHAFSGMRHQEALGLPYHCTEVEVSNGLRHFVLCGQTTKLNNGKIRKTKWVTVAVGHRAAQIAQRIADVIYRVAGTQPKKSKAIINKYPLFVSTGYLGATSKPIAKTGIYQTMALGLNTGADHSDLRTRLLPLIEDGDIRELEGIDPHRAWRSEEGFSIGQQWPLASHQFRRSLALYAQRSGLVSLPSLRRQLQHITKEMSIYYSRGSLFATDFSKEDPEGYNQHMAKEWLEAKPISEALAYLRDVVFSEEELFGGAGAFEQQKKKRGQVTDRDSTIKQFKKGLIGYKETPFGGCIKAGECDKVGLKLIGVLCLSECKNIVVKMSKMETLIHRQKRLVDSLDPSSAVYRMEKDDLESMNVAHARWSKRGEING